MTRAPGVVVYRAVELHAFHKLGHLILVLAENIAYSTISGDVFLAAAENQASSVNRHITCM